MISIWHIVGFVLGILIMLAIKFVYSRPKIKEYPSIQKYQVQKPKGIKIKSFGKCEGCGSKTFINGLCQYCGTPKPYEKEKYRNYGSSGITDTGSSGYTF